MRSITQILFSLFQAALRPSAPKKFIEIVYDLLIKAVELGSFALLKFGVRPVGLN
jgi:hypothetical protein